MLVWRHHLVSQSVSRKILVNKKFLKFYINFVEGFVVDLKKFWGLAMPNQSCLDVTKWICDLISKGNRSKSHIFVEGFMVDLKKVLGLAMPNQSCLDVTNEYVT